MSIFELIFMADIVAIISFATGIIIGYKTYRIFKGKEEEE